MKTIVLMTAVLVLAGCEQQFRYPCQDPENWDKEECKRPLCEVNRDCPDLIFKENTRIQVPAATVPVPRAPAPTKGECS